MKPSRQSDYGISVHADFSVAPCAAEFDPLAIAFLLVPLKSARLSPQEAPWTPVFLLVSGRNLLLVHSTFVHLVS